MNRRAFLTGLGAVLAAPLTAQAQPIRKMRRIGVLGLGLTTDEMTGENPRSRVVKALLAGLLDLGYVYGKHYLVEPRGAEGKIERFPQLVNELLRTHVDVIVAVPASAPALKQTAATIPVVLTGVTDPLGQGLAESLGHPGGQFTGLSNQNRDLIAKRLELLKQIVPSTAPVGVIWDHTTGAYVWHEAEEAARERGWRVLSLELRDAQEVVRAFETATESRAASLLVESNLLFGSRIKQTTELAATKRLPAVYAFSGYVQAGGLMSYGADLVHIWRRCAYFVDKILKGAKPGDLPIEQPTKFELEINLKTAKALGLTIPPSLLLRADQVIDVDERSGS